MRINYSNYSKLKEDLELIWTSTPIADPLRKARWQEWTVRTWIARFIEQCK